MEQNTSVGPFEAMTWPQAVRLVGALLIAAGLSTLCFVALAPPEANYEPWGVAIPALLGIFGGAGMLVLGDRFHRRFFYPIGPLGIALITIGQYFGPTQSMGAVLYVWIAIFSFYVHPRRHAAVNVALIGVGYAILLVVRPVPVALAVWLPLMLTVVVAAYAVGWLIEQVNRLALGERTARAAAEQAREDLTELNRSLATQVEEQVTELERFNRLRRFLAPQVADAILSAGEDEALAPHRREIAVLFCDLRGYTALAAEVEPEELLDVLDTYYQLVGSAVHDFEATIGAFAGDGVMAYFNDPLPCVDPADRAVQMATALCRSIEHRGQDWRHRGRNLQVGIGIAFGYASLGIIGFEDRREYTPLGTVVNLASRLCDEAKPGEILADRGIHRATGGRIEFADVGEKSLKGFPLPVPVFSVLRESGSL